MTALTRIEFLVLAALGKGPLHGYGIVQEVERISDGAERPRPGNLYRVLDRLLDRGLLAEADLEPVVKGGAARRRFYRITPAGRSASRREADMLVHAMASTPVLRDALEAR